MQLNAEGTKHQDVHLAHASGSKTWLQPQRSLSRWHTVWPF